VRSSRKPGTLRNVLAGLLTGTVLAVVVTGCGGGGSEDEAEDVTVWTLEDNPERIQATQEILDDFSMQSGVEVELLAVAEDQFDQLVTSSATADDLPDVIGAVGLGAVRSLAANDLLDTETPATIVDSLGRSTFSPRSLELTADGGTQLAVPSDGWAQLVIYRKDLFAAAGLPAPTTYDALLTAARQLNTPDRAGIVAATSPEDSFTQQTFEHLALANDCELADDGGNVTLNSPACVDSFRFYDELLTSASFPSVQDVDSTRTAYFDGRAAAVIWSSFLLDEMAGLSNEVLPTCPECQADPQFLAKNSGIVTGLQGPMGTEPAEYGEIVSWVVTKDADREPAQQLVEFMMSDGYERWLALAPEGKVPTRTGTPEAPESFLEAWGTLPAGVDTKRPLAEVYSPEVLAAVRTSVDTFQRWGITEGQGDLAGAILGELPIPHAIDAMLHGGLDPQAAAQQAQQAVEGIKSGLS
jgi:multiple sugar transport system substrate-binding protein